MGWVVEGFLPPPPKKFSISTEFRVAVPRAAWTFRRIENDNSPTKNRASDRSVRRLVTIMTELSRFPCFWNSQELKIYRRQHRELAQNAILCRHFPSFRKWIQGECNGVTFDRHEPKWNNKTLSGLQRNSQDASDEQELNSFSLHNARNYN